MTAVGSSVHQELGGPLKLLAMTGMLDVSGSTTAERSESQTYAQRGHQKCRPLYQEFPCRVAVLDGGFPAWQAKGYPVDSEGVSDAEVDAAAHAARQSKPSQARYPAKLQVGACKCLIPKHTAADRSTP